MKSFRQWLKLFRKSTSNTDFQKAAYLFYQYTGFGNKDNAQWGMYWRAILSRFFLGRWNTHHGLEVSTALNAIPQEPIFFRFPIAENEAYPQLLNEKNSPYKLQWRRFDKYSDEILKYYPEQEDLAAFKENSVPYKNSLSYKEGTIQKDNKSYKIIINPDDSTSNKILQMKVIILYPQLHELLTAIQKELGDTPINRKGDLAKILRVIKQETGEGIAIKYADYGIDHFAAIGKDFIDTFRPYKSNSFFYIGRDLKQPLFGIDNFIRGIFSLLAIPFLIARNALLLMFATHSWEDFVDNSIALVEEPFDYFVDGLSSMVRGITQIITAPLTYCLKIPLRLSLGIFQDNKPLIEDAPSFQYLLTINSIEAQQHMKRKYLKNKERDVASHIVDLDGFFSQINKDRVNEDIHSESFTYSLD